MPQFIDNNFNYDESIITSDMSTDDLAQMCAMKDMEKKFDI